MGNGFHLTLMTFRQLTFELCPDDDDADKDGDDGEDDNGSDEGVEGKGDGVLNQKNIVNFELIFYQQGQR